MKDPFPRKCGILLIAVCSILATGALAADDSSAAAAEGDALLRRQQQQMLDMHDLMHRIRDAKDKTERARLMDEHLQMLKDNWQEMRDQRRLQIKKRLGGGKRRDEETLAE